MKGYSEDLYILAFDHRGTITKGLLGVEGREPTEEEAGKVNEMKNIIFDGFLKAKESGITGGEPAILVDETFGLDVQQKAKDMGIKFAAPVEKSGQKVFDFEYGDHFGEKIKEIGADFVKILVRWNPDDDEETREIQGKRIKELSDWLSENDKKFLLEFLVPATSEQLESVGNDQARYDSEIRPMLAVKVVEEMRERGADPDIWKIEGLDTAEDCEKVAKDLNYELALNDAFLDQDYVLEVSTPGIDRKFFKAEQLSAFLKEEFDLKLREIKNGKKSLVAKLIDVNNDEILFDCGEEKMSLNFIDLDLCRLKPNFEELMRVNK